MTNLFVFSCDQARAALFTSKQSPVASSEASVATTVGRWRDSGERSSVIARARYSRRHKEQKEGISGRGDLLGERTMPGCWLVLQYGVVLDHGSGED